MDKIKIIQKIKVIGNVAKYAWFKNSIILKNMDQTRITNSAKNIYKHAAAKLNFKNLKIMNKILFN